MFTLLYLKWIINKDLLIADETLLSATWQPGWEKSLAENGYIYMYGWVPSLFTGNCHIVNQLCSKTKYKVKKKIKETRHLKLMNLVLFYVWGDAKLWAYQDHCFHMHLSYLGPPFHAFSFWVSFSSVQSLSHVWLFATPWTAAWQAFLSITNFQSLPKVMSIESMMPSNHLILCRPLHLLPPLFPSIRVFSNESVLCIRRPKYWSFSFNISLSNEHPGLKLLSMHHYGWMKWLTDRPGGSSFHPEFLQSSCGRWGVAVMWWLNRSNILCLVMWQATFFTLSPFIHLFSFSSSCGLQ